MIRPWTDAELDASIAEADALRLSERPTDCAFTCECPHCLAAGLLVAERLFWRPTDWSTVPAWHAWRAEVGARRRPPGQDDALLAAAYYEMLACLEAHCDQHRMAETYLRWADQAITEGLAA